jgi:hypothetical protein
MTEIKLTEGELVDTRGGFSYEDTWVVVDDEGTSFYRRVYGSGDYAYSWKRENSSCEMVYDESEIEYLKTLIKD